MFLVIECRETTGTNLVHEFLELEIDFPLANISLCFSRFNFLLNHLIIKCHVKIETSYLVEKEQGFVGLPFLFSTLNILMFL